MRAPEGWGWCRRGATALTLPLRYGDARPVDRRDPFAAAAAMHFEQMFRRYGTPIIVLNLVKKKERKPRESILGTELAGTVQYLNQFLPNEHKLIYSAWDMARCAKR